MEEELRKKIKKIYGDKEIQIGAKVTYIYILIFLNDKKINRVNLSKELTISNSTLGNHLKILEKKGYIRIERKRKKGKYQNNKYKV